MARRVTTLACITRDMKLRVLVASVLVSAAAVPVAAKGLTVEDMLAMQRVGDPQLSPDGKWVVYAVRDTDVDANRDRMDL